MSKIHVKIRVLFTRNEFDFEVETDKSVLELKESLANKLNLDPVTCTNQIQIISKGKVLNNSNLIKEHSIVDGEILYLKRPEPKSIYKNGGNMISGAKTSFEDEEINANSADKVAHILLKHFDSDSVSDILSGDFTPLNILVEIVSNYVRYDVLDNKITSGRIVILCNLFAKMMAEIMNDCLVKEACEKELKFHSENVALFTFLFFSKFGFHFLSSLVRNDKSKSDLYENFVFLFGHWIKELSEHFKGGIKSTKIILKDLGRALISESSEEFDSGRIRSINSLFEKGLLRVYAIYCKEKVKMAGRYSEDIGGANDRFFEAFSSMEDVFRNGYQ